MPLKLVPDFYKLADILLPLPPKPLAYAMLLVVILFPLFVLYYSSLLPPYMRIFAVVVTIILAYVAYLGWRATNFKLGRGVEGPTGTDGTRTVTFKSA